MESSSPPPNNNEPNIGNKYKHILSTLPRIAGWSEGEILYNYRGFWNPSIYLEGIIEAQQHFTPQPSDIFICSLPKSGMTWLKALCTAIFTRKHLDDPSHPLLQKMPHQIIPMLESALYPLPSSFLRDPEIPVISSHISFSSLPKSIINSDCKIIYICRDPKDVLVSFLHFYVKWRRVRMEDVPFEKAFEFYCKGLSHCGPFWNHILEYWNAKSEFPEKVLFLRYEDLKDDTANHVKRIAEFVGCGFSSEEEEEGVVDKIVKLCSFENISNLNINKSGLLHTPRLGTLENSSFFRKGVKGDWKNLLTAEMAERLDKITREKLTSSGFTFNSES